VGHKPADEAWLLEVRRRMRHLLAPHEAAGDVSGDEERRLYLHGAWYLVRDFEALGFGGEGRMLIAEAQGRRRTREASR